MSVTLGLQSVAFEIACDENSVVVREFARLIKFWDRNHAFTFLDRNETSSLTISLFAALDFSPWSLLLVDNLNNYWYGPEAVPFILKNLPFGKLAAAIYVLPGTMWLTKQLYLLISRNKQRFNKLHHARHT